MTDEQFNPGGIVPGGQVGREFPVALESGEVVMCREMWVDIVFVDPDDPDAPT